MTFESLIGNNKIKTLLANNIKSNNILHSYLFTGISGIGKSLFARELAKAILCSDTNNRPCGGCKSCLEFEGGSNPDFMQIEPEDGKVIKIEQIRYMQEKIAEKPVTSKKKVYIINECDTMTKEASNSLLKTLEEPPEYATIILVTSNESKLLVTIKSRCTKVTFNMLSEDEVKAYLAQSGLQNKNISDAIIRQCQGSIGRLIKILEEQDLYSNVDEIINELEKTDITKIWNNADVLYKEKDKILDLLDYINVIYYEKVRLEKNLKYTKAFKIVEEAKKRILANANYDMTIDNLLLKLWEEFS